MDILDALLVGSGSGLDEPAAVIMETVQGEGGVNVASSRWMQRVAEICSRHNILLIVDDIQVGCGRTGSFFSFEDAGIVPDIVTMSKSLSGSGLPLAVTLFKRDLDIWAPGEHNGTFRGNNPAFVTATAALRLWQDDALSGQVRLKGEFLRAGLASLAAEQASVGIEVRGRGMIWGLAFDQPDLAAAVCREAFDRGLLVETSGPESEVLKLLPPLTASIENDLAPGMQILGEALAAVIEAKSADLVTIGDSK
jgi:diaminobutyrate-2-oxoglutarate transaminase